MTFYGRIWNRTTGSALKGSDPAQKVRSRLCNTGSNTFPYPVERFGYIRSGSATMVKLGKLVNIQVIFGFLKGP